MYIYAYVPRFFMYSLAGAALPIIRTGWRSYASKCIYMHICICICICTHIYTYMCVYIHTHTHTHI